MNNRIQLNSQQNSLGWLRLILAIAVIYAHVYELGGFGHEFIYQLSGNLYSLGALAVDGFFALSGCLITLSYLRLQSFPRFLWYRILRIFPGYWACLCVVAIAFPLVLGQAPNLAYVVRNSLMPALTALQGVIGFFLSLFLGWVLNLDHLAAKIPLLQGQNEIVPLFTHNPIPNVVNGSLWTLEQEFRLYLAVGVLGLLGCLRKQFVIGLAGLIWLIYLLYLSRHPSFIESSFLRVSAHFLMGMVFCFWQPPLKTGLAIAAAGVGAIAFVKGFYPLVSPLTTIYLLLWLGKVLPFRGFATQRDYSYGLYIYAYPTQQLLSALRLNQFGLPVYLGLSLGVTLGLAMLSWHLVESNALRWKQWKQGLSARTAIHTLPPAQENSLVVAKR